MEPGGAPSELSCTSRVSVQASIIVPNAKARKEEPLRCCSCASPRLCAGTSRLASNVPNLRSVDADATVRAARSVQSFSSQASSPHVGGSASLVAELAEQPVKLVERGEGDRDLTSMTLARAAVAQADLHRGGEAVGELSFETKNVARLLTFRAQQRRLPCAASRTPGGELLGFTNVHALGDDFVGRLDLLCAAKRQQGPCVPHLDRPAEEQLLHGLAQLQKAQEVGRGAARAADGPGRGLVGEAEFLGQPLDAARFLQRVEILALHVLDQ